MLIRHRLNNSLHFHFLGRKAKSNGSSLVDSSQPVSHSPQEVEIELEAEKDVISSSPGPSSTPPPTLSQRMDSICRQ